MKLNVVVLFINSLQSDPNSGSTLQLDELEDLEDEVIRSESENQVINELKIRPKTKYKVYQPDSLRYMYLNST